MKKYSSSWKSSTQIKKQRKYRYNAPLHIKQKFVNSHLSAELRKKYSKRSIQLKSGDKVKIMVGNNKGKIAKVNSINIKKSRVFIEGIARPKIDGSKKFIAINPSNLMIVELSTEKSRFPEKSAKEKK